VRNPWLVRTWNGRFRVKWRDEEGILQDCDFYTEPEAREFGGSLLEFLPDMETMLVQANKLREQHPELSPEEAMERVGLREIVYSPPARETP
jgi:hypothetical protein